MTDHELSLLPYQLADKRIILASASPRRQQLLAQIGIIPHSIVATCVEEISGITQDTPAEKVVMENSKRKAKAAYRMIDDKSNSLIISADTIVVKDGRLYGKPANVREAAQMLRQLSDSRHEVYTGICILDTKLKRAYCSCQRTYVYFRALQEEEINAYLADESPLDKAGSYGIQDKGVLFVEKIIGDYSSVIGFSLPLFRRLLTMLYSPK